MSELVNPEWPRTTIKASSYLKGRIGWQGLRAEEFIDYGPFLITGTDFQGGHVNWTSCYHVSETRFQEGAYIHVRDGDLLITKDGTIGKVAYVTECPEKAVLNSGIFLLRCADGSYEHRFLYHLLRSSVFEEFLRLNLAGSTINHLYQNVFERFSFPIPERVVQKDIAAILDTIDLQIEQTEALIAKYQQIKAGLMHDLFTRGVTPDGKLRPTRAEAPHLYKQSPLGWIPKEWKVSAASQTCLLITKGTTPAEFLEQEEKSSIPYIRVQNLSFDGSLAFKEDQAFIPSAVSSGELARSRVLPSDILMNIVGPPLGKVSVVPNEYPEWNVNQAIAIFRTKPRESAQYLALYLLSNMAQSWFLARAKRTSGQVNLTLEMCRELPVPIPVIAEEQNAITARLESAENQVKSAVLSLNKLRQQKHGLMHDLLTGRVRVKVDGG